MSDTTALEALNTTPFVWIRTPELADLAEGADDGMTRLDPDLLPLYAVGELTDLSMARYAAAICLTQATELEAESVTLMETLTQQTAALEVLAQVEDAVLDAVTIEDTAYVKDFEVTLNGVTKSWVDCLREDLGCVFSVMAYGSYPLPDYYDDGIVPNQPYVYLSHDQYETLIAELESKMDAYNSLSQETMIDLQALLDRRDQRYTLLTAMLRTCSDSALAIAANY